MAIAHKTLLMRTLLDGGNQVAKISGLFEAHRFGGSVHAAA